MLTIFERLADTERTIINTQNIVRGEGYRFIGKQGGLYLFETREGKKELFAKRKESMCGWHLMRGAFNYEFVRSI